MNKIEINNTLFENIKHTDKFGNDHFVDVNKMVKIGSNAKRKGLRYREDILDNMEVMN